MSLLIVLSFALLQSPVASAGAAVSGQVVEDGSGTPIAGAQVTFIPNRPSPGPRPFQDRELMTTTDQDGRYEMAGLEAGRYRISVQKPGFASLSFLGMPEVVLSAGERREAVTVTLAKGAVIAGRVLDEAGEPLANAQVMALRKPTVPPGAPPMRGDVLIPGGPGAQTNDLGEFRLFSLAPGDYFLQASTHDRFSGASAPRTRTLLPTYFPGTLEAAAALPISVGAGQTASDVEIRMIGAAAFEISGLVLDEAGRPVLNALVRMLADEATGRPAHVMRPWQDSRTDASGKFLITSVTNGSYTLLAIAPVVIATPADQRGPAGAGAGSYMSFGSMSSSVSGTLGGGITTETRDGTTIQYRDDAGTRVPVTVSDGNIGGLQVIVRPPPR